MPMENEDEFLGCVLTY